MNSFQRTALHGVCISEVDPAATTSGAGESLDFPPFRSCIVNLSSLRVVTTGVPASFSWIINPWCPRTSCVLDRRFPKAQVLGKQPGLSLAALQRAHGAGVFAWKGAQPAWPPLALVYTGSILPPILLQTPVTSPESSPGYWCVSCSPLALGT